MNSVRWRMFVSVSAVALFVGSLSLNAIVPGEPFSRVLDMGVAPAFLEPSGRYPTTNVLSEQQVRLTTDVANRIVVYAGDLATVRVSAEQYARFRETWLSEDAKLLAYADLELPYSGQPVIDTGQRRAPGWLIRALLESGEVTVTDERSSEDVEMILVRETAYVCGPLCGKAEFTAEFPDGTVFFRLEVAVF